MAAAILTIDGSEGEGGGQGPPLVAGVVVGDRPAYRNRADPRLAKEAGLARQHLTAVLAAAEVGGAEVEGATLGSRRLVFPPWSDPGGQLCLPRRHRWHATLVLQTVLPALLIAEGESNLILEGGTTIAGAAGGFSGQGLSAAGEPAGTARRGAACPPGFYPAGGGEFTVHVQPARQLGRLELLARGQITARRVRALVARQPRHIAERECRTIAEETGWDADCFAVEEIQGSRGPGNAVMIELETEHVTEVFTAFGRLGVRAEDVAKEALEPGQGVSGGQRAGRQVPGRPARAAAGDRRLSGLGR